MAPSLKPWFKRPLPIIGLLLLAGVLAWAGFFAVAVAQNVSLIKSGKLDPLADFQTRSFEASVSQQFASSDAKLEDVAKLEQGVHPTLGNPAAAVHIVEFVDYGCPYCKKEAPIIREFMRRHANDVRLVLRDFPITELHPDAEHAALAANCVFAQGSPERFWSYYDRLFASQEAESPEDLRTYAEQLGANMKSYDACVASGQPSAAIQQSLEDGVTVGVQGTPTFFFNGIKIQGAIDADSLEIIVREAAKRALQK